MSLTLLVPDLMPPAHAPDAMLAVRLPGLEKWLGRAQLVRVAARGLEGWLGQAHGLALPIPVAAIALSGEESPPATLEHEKTWMRADPVHMRIERDLVGLRDASSLEVSPEEAAQLTGALQDLFGSDGLRFVAATPSRWYVSLPHGAAPATTPIAEAVGRDIFSLLPQGGGLNWRSAITEAQMVMSNHPVNAQREREGKPAINSVWFWGEGEAPAALAPAYSSIHAGDAFARGLALLSGAALSGRPASPDELPLAPAGKDNLAVLDGLTPAFRRGDTEAWAHEAKALDKAWFAKLGATITRHRGVSLVFPGESDCLVAHLAPASRWRVLKPRKALASLA